MQPIMRERMSQQKNTRALAAQIIKSVVPSSPNSSQSNATPRSLTDALNQPAVRNSQDIGLLKELCYGVLRNFSTLEWLLGKFLNKRLKAKDWDIHCLLLIGIYQVHYLRIPDHAAVSETVKAAQSLKKPWAKNLINGVLRNLLRSDVEQLLQEIEDPAVKSSHPSWFVKKVKASWPDQFESILQSNNQPAPMVLRVNQQFCSREEYLSLLAAEDLEARVGNYSDVSIYLNKPNNVEELPNFNQGWVSVQDEAAQLVAPLLELASGQRVLDACAAPGGKTCHMLELSSDLESVVALEIDENRAQRINENVGRLKLDQNKISVKISDALAVDQWWDQTPFDRILLDVPCSATGVIRRHPDIKWLRRAEDIDQLHNIQIKLLKTLWPLLQPGGILLYSTCSILMEENENIIAEFLKLQTDASLYTINTEWGEKLACGKQWLPTNQGPDGFYYARLKKE